MTRLDDQPLFDSGPSTLCPGPWTRQAVRRGLPGLDGELVLDLGLRSRTLQQTGRLESATAAGLHAQIEAIEARLDGQPHTLTDAHGRLFDRILLERFELTGPVRLGRSFWCDYRITYRQLP